jgi:hypothetical protein
VDPFTVTISLLALLFGGGVIFSLLWNRYRDKISEWNARHNIDRSNLSKAVVTIDKWITNISARVKVRRNDKYYDEAVFEERLSSEQIDALKDAHPGWFQELEQGRTVEVDLMQHL